MNKTFFKSLRYQTFVCSYDLCLWLKNRKYLIYLYFKDTNVSNCHKLKWFFHRLPIRPWTFWAAHNTKIKRKITKVINQFWNAVHNSFDITNWFIQNSLVTLAKLKKFDFKQCIKTLQCFKCPGTKLLSVIFLRKLLWYSLMFVTFRSFASYRIRRLQWSRQNQRQQGPYEIQCTFPWKR